MFGIKFEEFLFFFDKFGVEYFFFDEEEVEFEIEEIRRVREELKCEGCF